MTLRPRHAAALSILLGAAVAACNTAPLPWWAHVTTTILGVTLAGLRIIPNG